MGSPYTTFTFPLPSGSWVRGPHPARRSHGRRRPRLPHPAWWRRARRHRPGEGLPGRPRAHDPLRARRHLPRARHPRRAGLAVRPDRADAPLVPQRPPRAPRRRLVRASHRGRRHRLDLRLGPRLPRRGRGHRLLPRPGPLALPERGLPRRARCGPRPRASRWPCSARRSWPGTAGPPPAPPATCATRASSATGSARPTTSTPRSWPRPTRWTPTRPARASPTCTTGPTRASSSSSPACCRTRTSTSSSRPSGAPPSGSSSSAPARRRPACRPPCRRTSAWSRASPRPSCAGCTPARTSSSPRASRTTA